MPYIKPISGHTSTRGAMEYLQKDDRALSVDYVNIPEQVKDWAQWMDDTRHDYGNDTAPAGKRCRTYNHYVLSPDPKDNVSLDELREYALEWARLEFRNYECAIVCHNDSKERMEKGEEGILHAHIIVNNTNLATGRRLSGELTKARVREISKDAQMLAEDRGWHSFLDKEDWDAVAAEFLREAEEIRSLDEEEFTDNEEQNTKEKTSAGRGRYSTRQPRYQTKTEREIEAEGGWSWKQDLRDRVDIAKEISASENDFRIALAALGVKLMKTKKGDDYLYVHPERDTWKASGMRLGYRYSQKYLSRRIATTAARAEIRVHINIRYRQETIDALRSWGAVSVRSIGRLDPGSSTTLNDVAWAMALNTRCGIKEKEDYAAAIANAKAAGDNQAAKELERARSIMNEINAKGKYVARARLTKLSGGVRAGEMSAEELARWKEEKQKELEMKSERDFGGRGDEAVAAGTKSQPRQRTGKEKTKGR